MKPGPGKSNSICTGFYLLLLMLIPFFAIGCVGEDNKENYFIKAETALSQGRINEAASLYELYLNNESDPDKRFDAWERLALIYLDIARDPERGLNILKTMSIEFENDRDRLWNIYSRIGAVYVRERRLESATGTFSRAIEVAGDRQRVLKSYNDLARVYYAMRNFKRALETIENALTVSGSLHGEEQGKLKYLQGKIFYQLEEYAQAATVLASILYSDLSDNLRSKAGMLLYEALLRTGDESQAIDVLMDLETIYPNPMVIRMRMDGLQ